MSVTALSRIDPQPPSGIKYMLGGESWKPAENRTPIRLECEEWGYIGPMVLDASIPPNKAGFRVRSTTILAPEGAHGFTKIDGVYYWTVEDMYQQVGSGNQAANAEPSDGTSRSAAK